MKRKKHGIQNKKKLYQKKKKNRLKTRKRNKYVYMFEEFDREKEEEEKIGILHMTANKVWKRMVNLKGLCEIV